MEFHDIVQETGIKTIPKKKKCKKAEWLPSKSLQTINAGEDVEKGNPFTLLVGMQTGTATMENNVEFP